MDFSVMREDIENLVNLVRSLPEEYRLPAFELMLEKYLDVWFTTGPDIDTTQHTIPSTKLQLPIDVRAFLALYEISEDQINRLFLIEDDQIRRLHSVSTRAKSKSQIRLALYLALENAIRTGDFYFSFDQLRTELTEIGKYDSKHFMEYFRNNRHLFKSFSEPDRVELTVDGKQELADLIWELL